MASSIPSRPLATAGVDRGDTFTVEVNGRQCNAHEGESVLGVLWAAGFTALRLSPRQHQPRGFYCGMGVCFDCLVEIDGRANVRACLEPARPGMSIRVPDDVGDAAAAGGAGA